MVDQGQLTMGEKQQLLDQVEQRIETVKEELRIAEDEKKPKKVFLLDTLETPETPEKIIVLKRWKGSKVC